MVLSVDTPRSKYLIYGFIALLILNLLCVDDVSGKKMLFCRNCRLTRSTVDPSAVSTATDIAQAHIINAPRKCKAGFVVDTRNNCRRVVFSN